MYGISSFQCEVVSQSILLNGLFFVAYCLQVIPDGKVSVFLFLFVCFPSHGFILTFLNVSL